MGDIQGGGRSSEKPVHRVWIGKFAMGMYEVTVGEFRKFVNSSGYRTDADKKGSCYSHIQGRKWLKGANWRFPGFSQNDNHPVACISWNDATAYTKWLSNQTGKQYRLPTEAEWEYAARAGTETKYWWGNTASHEYMNYGADSCCSALAKGKDRWKYTAPVGSFAPNSFGIYDTAGNVWEWVLDIYKYTNRPRSNPRGPSSGPSRVIRSGGWSSSTSLCRAANANISPPGSMGESIGFRVSRE